MKGLSKVTVSFTNALRRRARSGLILAGRICLSLTHTHAHTCQKKLVYIYTLVWSC